MPSFTEYLESFNRKERFFLIGSALGNPTFQLAPEFRDALTRVFGTQVPDGAFAAMDYHLDWIHASLYLTQPGNKDKRVHPNTKPVVTGNQEDVDLIVAFEEAGTTHLLLIEAKAYTAWSNTQMCSKAKRLDLMFGADGTAYPEVRPQFGLLSPRPSRQLDTSTWPRWMTQEGTPIWFELSVPSERRRITLCDSDGAPSAGEGFFRVSG